MTHDYEDAVYRIRWLTDRGQTMNLLAPGTHRVGSDPRNEICLTERGVSRLHATLHVSEERCDLEDQGSKNGSTVNGRPFERGAVRPGDVLGFGTARCVLERVERNDVELALAVDWSTGGRPTTRLGGTSRAAGAAPLDSRLLRCIDHLLRRLRMAPAPDLDGAVADLARELGLRGACLAEWPSDGSPRFLAAAGDVGTLPTREELVRAQRLPFDRSVLVATTNDALLTAQRSPQIRPKDSGADDPETADFLGLLVSGTAGTTVQPLLLATFLRVLRDGLEQPETLHPWLNASKDLRLPEGIVAGVSSAMESVYRQVAMLASDPVPVLVLGETGVGKEHLAQALHDHSARHAGPFVAINCAAVPSELLEAELFGIGSGVATGVSKRRGKLVQADGGTLFLDEIGDMPATLQAKLLRALQEGEVTPLGEAPVRVDVRWIAATHTDLDEAIEEGRFRQDLYYRLAGFELRVPPLRRRPEDLPGLVGCFLQEFGRQLGRNVRGITVKALQHLAEHPWPGNVRELRHVVRRLVYLCPAGGAIDSAHVIEAITRAPGHSPPTEFELGSTGLEEFLEGHERVILAQALARTGGNRTQAAKLLRISRNSLTRRVQRLGLEAT
ncbi:MAG: sigma 54-interacting transcriptional regulator [Thermoanaerobaculia bacterium]|nr:sigma 54-interacting transcriptional regulator [Thermoanaerobaculia bacterium]